MPLDTRPPERTWEIDIRVETIGNGYLASVKARPGRDDPMAQRSYGVGPFYLREVDETPLVVTHLLELIRMNEAAARNAEED